MALGGLRGATIGSPGSMAGVEAVLLDALGTLLDLPPPAPSLARSLRRRHGVDVSLGQAERALRAEMAFYRAHNHVAADRAGLQDLRCRCAAVLREGLGSSARHLDLSELARVLVEALRFEPFAEVPDVLRGLRRRGLRLVIVSNWDFSLHGVLADTGLADLVDGVVTSAEVGTAKPGRAIFEAGLARAGVAAGRALHLGDSLEEDFRGASAAGVRAVLLSRAVAAEHPVPAIASLRELPGLLDAA